MVEPSTKAETIDILKGCGIGTKNTMHVKITDDAVEAAVEDSPIAISPGDASRQGHRRDRRIRRAGPPQVDDPSPGPGEEIDEEVEQLNKKEEAVASQDFKKKRPRSATRRTS